MLKKLLLGALCMSIAAAAFALPANWKLYIPGSADPSNPKADVEAAGFTVSPEFEKHFSFVDNTTNGLKALKLDTRDNRADVLKLDIPAETKRVTILFKAKGSLIPDNGETPFGILWACWQRDAYQGVLRHNQTNQIKGSTGQTNLRPDNIVSDWNDFRLVFQADETGRNMTSQAFVNEKLRHETKDYSKRAAYPEVYDPLTFTGRGNYVLFGENDGSTNGFARYAYILIILDEDVSSKTLAEISASAGADLVTVPVTANDPAPLSLKPKSKPAGINMTDTDGIPDFKGDKAAIENSVINLDSLPYSKHKAEKVVRNPVLKKFKADAVADVSGAAGAYKTIAEAVEAVKPGSTILVKPGLYREKLKITKPVNLIGENPASTIIYGYEADFGNIDGNLLVEVDLTAEPAKTSVFAAENITFYNKGAEWNATWNSSERRSIALALKGVQNGYIKNCVFIGQQDTMYLKSGRIYFENSYIEGEVDFICGGATVLFDNCHIHSIFYKNGGYITAAAPADIANTDPKLAKFANGYVFRNSIIDGHKDITDKKVYLGRGAWVGGSNGGDNPAKVVYMNCELGQHIDKEGWRDWDNVNTIDKAYFREYNNTGKGAIAEESKTRKFITEAEYKASFSSTKAILGFIPKIKY